MKFTLLFIKKLTPINIYGIRYLSKNSARKKEFKAKKLIGFSNNEMYEVIADVQSYENFLPFCNKSTIVKYYPKELHANLVIGFPPIVENYNSTVFLEKPNAVQAICSNGKVFHYLETTWVFHPGLQSNPKSCIIDFSIKFHFKSVLYSHLASLFFNRLVQQMESAFMKEAARRYGQPSIDMYILNIDKS